MHISHRFPLAATCALLLGLTTSAAAVEPVDGRASDYPALGLNGVFARWNRTVRLVYDPDNAPALFASEAHFLDLLKEATAQWERVSGIRFQIVGADRNAPDDIERADGRDGIARISWANLSASGLAGSARNGIGPYDALLGYSPYDDSSIELNNASAVIDADYKLVGVLVHELGHLLGLGHSDVANSVMFANPYNYLLKPRADDVRGLQALYGLPAAAFDVGKPPADWLYAPPPDASSADTAYLFKANAHSSSGNGAYLAIDGGISITEIGANAPDSGLVNVRLSAGVSSMAINVPVSVVLVDPAGYAHTRDQWTISCAANAACVFRDNLVRADIMKTLPGNWQAFIESADGNKTLLKMTLPVTSTVTSNQGPRASVTVAPSGSYGGATFTVTARDPEGNDMEVRWHAPLMAADNDRSDTLASGASVSRTLNFPEPGTHTFFVEVNDVQPRYSGVGSASSAGSGFQTLLKVTATLSNSAVESLQVVSNRDAGASTTSVAVLKAVAVAPANQVEVTTSDRSATTASFKVGASIDLGKTTQTTFARGDVVVVAGSVIPQLADVGKSADIFIVLRTTTPNGDFWSWRSNTGAFVPWNVTLAALQPAYSVPSLQNSQAFEIHNGRLISAQQRIYIGYRTSGSTTLHFTGQAHSLTVN